MKGRILMLLMLVYTANMSSQNMLRTYFNIVISNKDLQKAYNECESFFNNPIVTTSDDKNITAYSFNTDEGRVIFGRNNATKKIEAVVFLILDNDDSTWIKEIISVYFYEDLNGEIKNSYNNFKTMIYKFDVESNVKNLIGIGNESIILNIPLG